MKIKEIFNKIISAISKLHLFSVSCKPCKKKNENNAVETGFSGKLSEKLPTKWWLRKIKREKIYSYDYKIYLNHMENTIGSSKENWNKVWNVMTQPMIIIPIFIGFLSLIGTFCVTETISKSLLAFISAIGIGIGVNHFTFLFKEQTENRMLKFKAEHTARQINSIINKVLFDQEISDTNKSILIEDLLNLIDFWKDYYPDGSTDTIAKLKDLRKKQTDSVIEEQIQNIETNLLSRGLSSYLAISGDTREFKLMNFSECTENKQKREKIKHHKKQTEK